MSANYIKIVPKVWGEERWIRNDDLYCMKELVLWPGFRCSLHYHKKKTETFYVVSGRVIMEVGRSTERVAAGGFTHIACSRLHRFGVDPGWVDSAYILECSTHHNDKDSYRLEPSGRIPK